jgi:choline kinase
MPAAMLGLRNKRSVWMPRENQKITGSRARPASALLLAAGLGSRLKSQASVPKPLVEVAGRSLAERAVVALQSGAGISRFVVSVGYEADVVKTHFADIARRCGIIVDFVSAPDWPLGNGASTLAAKEQLADGPFLLSMSDHLFDPGIAGALAAFPLRPDEMCLAVDRDLDGIFDLDDVTRVRCEGDQIVAIEKNLEQWNCADTGVMICNSSLFDGLQQAAAAGKHGLSDGLRHLAGRGQAKVVDITGKDWIDVDTPEAYREAELRIAARASADPVDNLDTSPAA